MATPTNPTPTLTAPTGINKREVIQASELRIGNHINTPDGIGVVDGLATYYKKPIISVSGNSYIQNSVFGIPLTEELLLKMGFEKLPHFTITNSLILKLSRGRMITVSSVGSPNLMVWIENVDGKDITDLVCIHNWDYDGELHVHTLQNIVCLLGKKELTLS